MRILFIGDPHLRMNRFGFSLELWSWIESEIEKHDPDIVINLGDTFHDHAVLRAELLEEFRQHILRVTTRLNKKYYYILGNHDQYKPKDAKYHALQNFNNIKNFVVIDSVYEELDGITMVPFIANHDEFPLTTKSICIAHQTFIGADYGYMRESAGVDAGKVTADIIISGHVHKKQEFGKVIYPGIPYAQNANDVDQSKAILLFDTKTFEKTWISSPFPLWRSIEFIVAPDNPIDGLYEILEESVNDKDHWIVKIEGPKAEITAFLGSDRYRQVTLEKSITPRPTFTDKDKKSITIQASSTNDVLKDFVEKIYSGGIDKNKLADKVLEIHQAVKNGNINHISDIMG